MRQRPERTTYFDREADEKERGESFFPGTVFKDIVAATFVLLVIVGLATFVGAPLELEANPTGSAKAPRPDWYFLFLFEALKYLPGQLEWIGAVLVPTIAIAVLFFLPLFDRSPWRHPLNRRLASGVALFTLAGIAVLTFRGATAPEPPAVGAPSLVANLSPLERTGKRVYDDHSCAVCHRLNGVGGTIGPDLSTVGRRLDATWLIAHLESPAEIVPGTRMPQITLSNDELMALTAYLLSLRQPETRTPAQLGAAIFAVYCDSCHPGGKAGIGPAAAGVPRDRLVQIVRAGGRGMPAFSEAELTDIQLAQIIAHLETVR
ncbi:MAG: c-type cytochrome [Chloroflexota bacterium]